MPLSAEQEWTLVSCGLLALADRVLALLFAVGGSLAVVFVTELARPWLQRRARRLAGDATIPPPPRLP